MFDATPNFNGNDATPDYVETNCPFCGKIFLLPKWQFDLHKNDNDCYCSNECIYEAETGKPGEEY